MSNYILFSAPTRKLTGANTRRHEGHAYNHIVRLFTIALTCVTYALVSGKCLEAQWTSGSGGSIYFNGGSVGIGTTTPSAKLDVYSGGDSTNIKFEGATGKLALWPYYSWGGNTYGTLLEAMNMAETAYTPMTLLSSTLGILTNGGNITISGGNVGIGTTSPQYSLSVNGTIQAKEVLVNSGWADYVFDPEYFMRPLAEVDAYIKGNHHLPGIPSAADVKENGVGVGEMQTKLLAQVEELTLRMIELDRRDKKMEQRIKELEKDR